MTTLLQRQHLFRNRQISLHICETDTPSDTSIKLAFCCVFSPLCTIETDIALVPNRQSCVLLFGYSFCRRGIITYLHQRSASDQNFLYKYCKNNWKELWINLEKKVSGPLFFSRHHFVHFLIQHFKTNLGRCCNRNCLLPVFHNCRLLICWNCRALAHFSTEITTGSLGLDQMPGFSTFKRLHRARLIDADLWFISL